MSQWMPCKRRDFIRKLRNLAFDGPYSGTRHQFMIYKHHRMTIPSNSDYSLPQLKMLLREIERILERTITAQEWNNL